ncbi:regulator of chromosome condensation 1/beta-lactamase-inhibitor protein II [Phyllosticta capitalensis]|uniref:Regulator of chromosome condensation 1/beta-lactamase-inhibitor protein II n=1 Tax=Phyllosticta capitalensis TaxID=121624 RepID=A0ABR1YY64_9PEZI
MLPSRTLRQSSQRINKAAASTRIPRGKLNATARKGAAASTAASTQNAPAKRARVPGWLIIFTGLGSAAAFYQYSAGNTIRRAYAEEPEKPEVEFTFEKRPRKGSTKEENRDILSSQHLQVKRSWESPGVYAWGSNAGKVVAPDSDETYIKTPRRIPYFDGILLRDLKLDRYFGAAINENGDLLQWGIGYDKDSRQPAATLRGKNLKSLVLSKDRIIGLSANGKVYSVPVSKSEQEAGSKPSEGSWIPFWSWKSPIAYRKIEPKNLAFGEKITDIAGGQEHVLMLTSKGRVFSAASSALDFPSKGQLGVPGLSWTNRPEGPYDQPHELSTLRGFEIAKIAAGDIHSLVADKDGRVFSFGDNSMGQLGFDYDPEAGNVDAPSLLPFHNLYRGTGLQPRVTGLAAGGNNSYFTVDATRVSNPGSENDEASVARRNLGRITADTWACGQGIWGQLGNGRWTHLQGTPTKIPSLSGLFEYDELANKPVPIRLANLSVGANHVAAVMSNIAQLTADGTKKDKHSENETNWGADIVFFGKNENYQIGTGKRNNISQPTYIQPLDQVAERKVRGKEEHRFQITPKKKVKVNGRWVELEQRVECGREATAVYSGV